MTTFAGFTVSHVGYNRYTALNYDNCAVVSDGHRVNVLRGLDIFTMIRQDILNEALKGVDGGFDALIAKYPDTFLKNGVNFTPDNDMRALLRAAYEDVQYAQVEYKIWLARLDNPRHATPILWQSDIKAWVELINPNPGQAMKFNRKSQEWV